ncbi:cysteine-rich receptor-like protein kinase 8 isoform X2 [Beta vulgaris subsp. vulgaris]|uniref:cysteine-rich receptor-like protein kinase 8 isoform X2 n=1 Tax=Beta vulgaris subsp. vulgaris TaxID=3555 RepID=UPI00203666D0|nr:cysteine-rich receptor-like protein kinase 8 isoform X2 [Beta vulgaris subsp. vulgaris]
MKKFTNYLQFIMLPFLIMLLCLLDTTASLPVTINYNDSDCYNSSTYALHSSYETNLKHLLSTLLSQISIPKHIFSTHIQGSQTQDPAYGLALCRGDLNSQDCHNCVQTASKQLKNSCPRATQAILWKEHCMIRYSNNSFFGALQEIPNRVRYNENRVIDIDRWPKFLQDALKEVISMAASNYTGNMLAAKEAMFLPMNKTLYILAQCTPDLSMENCSKCLTIAQSKFVNMLQNGEVVLMPSCNLRYEIYKFDYVLQTVAPTPTGKKSVTKLVIAITVPLAILGMLIVLGTYLFKKKAKKSPSLDVKNVLDDLATEESLMFELGVLEAATNNFSDDQKLGQGGFGAVYKGTLPNGQEIAVKRLSKISSQGVEEFKNEVVLIANLQHRNLVRLLGFCLAGKEKLLVYEFIPNKSLNYFLFGKQGELNWPKRYDIIRGVARGLLYLHEDSRPRIIHRDLKSGNILLDAYMNPKISDFGLARIFKVEQTEDDTSKVVGTYGYMAPEYAMYGQFSVKSDVYSFGVLVLEIVSGKKISARFHPTENGDLLSHAWKSLTEEKPLEFMDSTLKDSYSVAEVLKCIQIGLWCAQENTDNRPTMSTVVHMLNTDSSTKTIPTPQCPRSFYTDSTESSLVSGLGPKSTTTTSTNDSIMSV